MSEQAAIIYMHYDLFYCCSPFCASFRHLCVHTAGVATRVPGGGPESRAVIHCCAEISTVIGTEDTQSHGVLLALGLECGSSDGRVALFDPKRCVTIASLSIPERASCMVHIPPGECLGLWNRGACEYPRTDKVNECDPWFTPELFYMFII